MESIGLCLMLTMIYILMHFGSELFSSKIPEKEDNNAQDRRSDTIHRINQYYPETNQPTLTCAILIFLPTTYEDITESLILLKTIDEIKNRLFKNGPIACQENESGKQLTLIGYDNTHWIVIYDYERKLFIF